MNAKIVATKGCSHCQGLQHGLRDMGVMCEVLFIEDHPDVITSNACV